MNRGVIGNEDKTAAIIVAGGAGTRMEATTPKQFRMLGGVPVLMRTIAVFERSLSIDKIIIVVPEAERDGLFRGDRARYRPAKPGDVRVGGATRRDSVAAGLEALDDSIGIVAVHDGARPLVTVAVIDRCVEEARRCGAAVVGVPVTDTLKVIDANRTIIDTADRESLWHVQTPQVFRRDIIVKAYERALRDGRYGTDDATLVERIGVPVTMVDGSRDNIKITYEEDILIAEALLAARSGTVKEN